MMPLFQTTRRPAYPQTSSLQKRPSLVRTFVETGDERCPIAGIWSRLDTDVATEDPELPLPAMRRLLPWRAFLPRVHGAILPSAI